MRALRVGSLCGGERLGVRLGHRPKSDRLARRVLRAVADGRNNRWMMHQREYGDGNRQEISQYWASRVGGVADSGIAQDRSGCRPICPLPIPGPDGRSAPISAQHFVTSDMIGMV